MDEDFRQIASQRMVILAEEIGRDSDFARGWIAEASRMMGLKYSSAHALCTGKRPHVSLVLIQQFCRKTGCKPSYLLDDHWEGKNGSKRKSKLRIR